MKSHYNRKFNQIFMVLFALSVGHLSYTLYRKSQHLSFWGPAKNLKSFPSNTRMPSSHTEFNQDAIDNLKDYFNFSTFKKYVQYDLGLSFTSNVASLKEQSQWKPLFHRSLEKTLSPKYDKAENFESIFLTAFNDSLLNDFTTNFLEELSLRKIKTGQFQVDITFKPKLTPQFSYNSEISSNQLIHWGLTNNFQKNLREKKKEEQMGLPQHILTTQLPNTSPAYQYKGGIITIWFEVSEDQKTSGFIRFRKYFTAPHISSLEPYIKQKDFRLTMIHFKDEANANELFVTSDFYQSYSLDKPRPKAERLELHFGKLLPNNLSQKNLGSRELASLSPLNKSAQAKERSLDLGSLNLHGVANYDGTDHHFTSKIESLVFDFEKGNFHQNSRIRTTFRDTKLKGHRRGALKHKVAEKILNEHGLSLIQKFRLDTLNPRFKGAKGSQQ